MPARRTVAARSCHKVAGGIAKAVSHSTSPVTRSGAACAIACAIRPPIDNPATCTCATSSASSTASASAAIAIDAIRPRARRRSARGRADRSG